MAAKMKNVARQRLLLSSCITLLLFFVAETSQIIPKYLAEAVYGTVAGICTVSLISQILSSKSCSSPHSLDTFASRAATMLDQFNPENIFYTSKELRNIRSSFAKQKPNTTSMAFLDSTHQLIPVPFRMPGYVIFNSSICFLIQVSTNVYVYLFWHFVNQTHAALANYYNGNVTTKGETYVKEILTAYVITLVSSLGSCIGLIFMYETYVEDAEGSVFMKLLPVPCCALAGVLNCYFMRRKEVFEGIMVYKSKDMLLEERFDGKSKLAARKAVLDTCISRALLPISTFLIPAIVMHQISTRNFSNNLSIPTFVNTVSFGLGLPLTSAIFPSTGSINLKHIEPTFITQISLLDKDTTVFYRRGI